MKRKSSGFRRSLALAIVVFAVLIAGATGLISRISGVSSEAEHKLVVDAVQASALTCFAVEGGYPQSLQYLKDNYGLTYDSERFMVVYNAFASNILPDIRVLERGAE